jgi:membrane-associated HD superfamily phosphohydrolase
MIKTQPRIKIHGPGDLEYLDVSPNLAEDLLDLNETQWLVIQEEAIRTLGDALRPSIREDQIDAARQKPPIPDWLLHPGNTGGCYCQPCVTVYCGKQYLQRRADRLAQEQAISTTAPVTRTYVAGEIIVRRGQILSETAIEALNQYGLIKPDDSSRNIVIRISYKLLCVFNCRLVFKISSTSYFMEQPRHLF